MMKKVILKLIALAVIYFAGSYAIDIFHGTGASTVVANNLAIDNVNGKNAEFMAMQSYNAVTQNLYSGWATVFAIVVGMVFSAEICRLMALSFKKLFPPATGTTLSVLLACVIPFLGSCSPYKKPIFVDIDTHKTAFVIPLEGDSAKQVKFDSKDALESRKVSAKRIEIPTRWNKTGRSFLGIFDINGEWIETVKVIQVNRSPVTRNWEAKDGSSKGKDQAIWVESADSVGFSMGFNCTAFIKEEDTSTFLYWYASGSLSDVMDSEIRGRIQQVAAEESAKFPLDDLRNKKNEIAESVRKDIITFFQNRGITITAVGMFGGMTYENPAIQTAIDNVFVSQQEKNVALAKFDAQKKENERIVLASEGKAKQKQIDAEAAAKARQTEADAEAKAIAVLTTAVAQGGTNYLALKALEVQLKQTEKWDGKLPTVSSGVSPLIDAGRFLDKK